MKRRLLREVWWVGLLPLLAVGSFSPLRGDEARSLALLVETLENSSDPQTRAALLRGMYSGLAGRRNVPAPQAWSRVATKLSQSKNAEVRELVVELSQVFGDLAATRKALATLLIFEICM